MDHLVRTEQMLDSIDAEVFSGDTFHSREGIEILELYVGRWSRALVNIKEIVAECEENGERGLANDHPRQTRVRRRTNHGPRRYRDDRALVERGLLVRRYAGAESSIQR